MRGTHVLTFLLATAIATPAAAQNWTAEQQEIIDFGHACWTTWATEDWGTYEQACPMDRGARYRDMAESVPSYGHRSWRPWSEAMWPHLDALHYEHRPIAVQVLGDVAMYYFFASYFNSDTKGDISTFTQHELAVFERRDAGWVLIGGAVRVFPGQ